MQDLHFIGAMNEAFGCQTWRDVFTACLSFKPFLF